MLPITDFTNWLTGLGFEPTPETLSRFETYAEMLVDWNTRINLTAITDPEGIAVKHFLDSLLLLRAVEVPENAKLLDVGAGAGFPSLPCKLIRPDLSVTLLDSLQKRIGFLETLCESLGITAAAVHGRAEELGRVPAYREQFDLVTARAVANLRELSEYCLPFVRVGGVFAALKGSAAEEEAREAEKAITLLGGRIREICPFTLPDGGTRGIVVIEKRSQTPTKYPRNAGKMKKAPL